MSFISWHRGMGIFIVTLGFLSPFSQPARGQTAVDPAADDPWKVVRIDAVVSMVGVNSKCADVEEPSDCSFTIVLEGIIEPAKTPAKFEKAIARWDRTARLYVVLNSPGGDVGAALKIGRIIRNLHAHTIVESTARCASACVFVFAAGVSRIVGDGGIIGIHRPALSEIPKDTEMENIKDRMDRIASVLRSYAAQMNISERLIDDMLVVPPEDMRWLSKPDRERYGLGFLDPSYEESAVLSGARRYNITPTEYRQRNTLARSSCNDFIIVDEINGILEGQRSKCAEHILAGGDSNNQLDPPCRDGSRTCKPWELDWSKYSPQSK